MTTHVVIMAGGQGTRLFPLSTPQKPKQFLDLADKGSTLIQLTYDRFALAAPDAHFWVVTAADYVPIVREQLPSIPPEQIIAEPQPRNTAPCIALACRKIQTKYPDSNIVITPADAFVADAPSFAKTISNALVFTASRKAIVTVGITPTEPHTGYGYIEQGAESGAKSIFKVSSFKEKPSLAVAREYLRKGSFRWNAGIFVWNSATIEQELRSYAPDIACIIDQIQPSFYTQGETTALAELFPQCPKISIDYAVMEKSAHVYTIAGDWPWSDLGSFAAIEAITGKTIPQEIKDAQEEYQAQKSK